MNPNGSYVPGRIKIQTSGATRLQRSVEPIQHFSNFICVRYCCRANKIVLNITKNQRNRSVYNAQLLCFISLDY